MRTSGVTVDDFLGKALSQILLLILTTLYLFPHLPCNNRSGWVSLKRLQAACFPVMRDGFQKVSSKDAPKGSRRPVLGCDLGGLAQIPKRPKGNFPWLVLTV